MKSPRCLKREKKSILQILIQYLKKKPVTDEDLKQFRLEAEKYRLKADIAKSKAIIRDSKGAQSSLVGAKEVDLFGNNDGKSDKEKEAYRKRVLGL